MVDQIAKRGGRAIAVRANVARKADIEHLFVEAKKAFGKIDILVNNAGVYEWSPLEEITEEQFHKHFDVNVLGLLLATQEAVKQFDSAGGNIINISSTVTSLTPPSSSVYTGTKGAVDAITRTLAKELGPRKIRVNAINPGLVETEGVRSAGFDQGDLRKSIEAADTARPHRPTRRHCSCRGLSRVVRFRVDHRRNAASGGWPSLIGSTE